MGIVIGIDVGISTTKIVGIDEQGKVLSPIRIRATDPVTSLYGAFGKYLHENRIKLSDVEKVMLTGVGSAYINEPVYGLSTDKAEEFVADGLGARYETKLDRMLVVSLGTGTSIVKCDGDDIKHIGGIGIGGGTLQGLSRLLLKTDDIKQFYYILRSVANSLLIAVISIHKNKQISCADAYFSTLVIARRSAHASYLVTIHRQSGYVYHSTTNAFIRFTLSSYAENQRVSAEMVGIKGTYTISVLHAGKVYQVHECVNLIQLFALQHTTYECFARRTIARRILTT
jgi:hypothetical protein